MLVKWLILRASSSFSSFDELLKTIPSKGLCSCPWCPEDKFIPTWRARLVKHLESVWCIFTKILLIIVASWLYALCMKYVASQSSTIWTIKALGLAKSDLYYMIIISVNHTWAFPANLLTYIVHFQIAREHFLTAIYTSLVVSLASANNACLTRIGDLSLLIWLAICLLKSHLLTIVALQCWQW